MRERWLAPVAILWLTLIGCDQTGPSAPDPSLVAGHKKPGVGVCSPGAGFTTQSGHPFFPMQVGRRWRYEGEEDGEAIELVITVLDLTRQVSGVTTRVIEERERVDGELLEVSWNYYAQASNGTICYFGEDVDIFEEDGISHEGAWCADEPGNAPGIFLPADPRPGTRFQMEIAPGVAEDRGKIVGIGPWQVPAGRFTRTIRVREFNPLDGDKGYKIFAAGTGLIQDGPAALQGVSQTSGTPAGVVPTDQECGG